MLFRTRVQRCYGQVLYPPTSTLPGDFYHCCATNFNIVLHEKTFIGIRASQHRGLFLSSEGRTGALPANMPIATIPLATLYTERNVAQKPNTLHDLTLAQVRDAIPVQEFKVMAPQLYLGMQFAAITAALPDISRSENAEALQRMFEVMRVGANPWARMLDDEDFNEDFVFGMYGMTLDTWQRSNYEEMTKGFHACTLAIHEAVNPPFKIEHFRRISRLVLARVEHVPPADYYDGSAFVRRLKRSYRRLRKVPDPAELAMVPLLDLINHSNRPNCGVRIGPSPALGGKGAITLFSLCPINPGQEICRHYNFALKRDAALFRYGFLPFDLISIVEHDAANEHVFKNMHMMRPKADEVLEKEKQLDNEVARLERIFADAKRQQAPDPSLGDRVSRREK